MTKTAKTDHCSECKAAITKRAGRGSGLCSRCYQRMWRQKKARINADLIAAAPQMLEALKWACDERANRCICEADCDGEPPCTAEACPIYEAIKAATGVEKDRFYGWP